MPALAACHTAAHYRVRARNDPILHGLQPRPGSGQQHMCLSLPGVLRLIPLPRLDAAQTYSCLALCYSTRAFAMQTSQVFVSCTISLAKEQIIDNVLDKGVGYL